MNEKPPKNPNLRIEYTKGLSFPDEETKLKFEKLKKALDEANSPEEKAKIEFAIRQLLLS